MSPVQRFITESADGDEFLSAIDAGDLDRSDRLLAELPDALPDRLLHGVAELHMLRERWAEAAVAFARIRQRGSNEVMRLRLCRNLACLQQHRPEIYRVIAAAEPENRYELIASKAGPTTITYRHDDGHKTILSGENDPLGSVAKVRRQIHDALAAGTTLGLAGIGDGYLLRSLADEPPKLPLGRQHAIALFEPDPRLLLACMMIHDYTGPAGPIEQERIRWFIGAEWKCQLNETCLADLMIPYPQVMIRLGRDSAAIEAGVKEFLAAADRLDARARLQLQSYYQHLSSHELGMIFGERPHRGPRIMVITTRFSTVLQHSSRDVADAMRGAGWEVLLLMEPSGAHAINRMSVRQALARFKPDLVFQIDHLRAEWGDLFPANLPTVCWIQDNLPNLTTVAAGKSVGVREFVLIPSLQRYVKNFAYPEQNCLEFRKLTKLPPRPQDRECIGDDLVYVSNWSQEPAAIAEELVRDLGKLAPSPFIADFCQRMIETYAAGGSLHTPGDVRRLLEQAQAEHGLPANAPARQLCLITAFFERLNNALYRQQGLDWAATAARECSLNLAVYGSGWEKHPRFAAFARRQVSYGAALESISRSARINLVLEPYVCITHQRLLDCLAAGGFVLSRAHPQTHIVQSLIDLFADGYPDDAAVQRVLAQSRDHDATPDTFDPVVTLRHQQEAGFLPWRGPILPRLDETSFRSQKELILRVQSFATDDAARAEIVDQQRRMIESRYSYGAGMQRMMQWIQARIAAGQASLRRAG
jgi:hypothetical protein